MLENCQNAKERWGGVSEIIDRWLKARQDLIVRFCDISGLEGISEPKAVHERFRRLCELMVDYVSVGHFEVYEQLVREAQEFNDEGIAVAREIYPKIEKTTEDILRFNDIFDAVEVSAKALNVLQQELSRLGEILEDRFEMEDMLIQNLHSVHADQVV